MGRFRWRFECEHGRNSWCVRQSHPTESLGVGGNKSRRIQNEEWALWSEKCKTIIEITREVLQVHGSRAAEELRRTKGVSAERVRTEAEAPTNPARAHYCFHLTYNILHFARRAGKRQSLAQERQKGQKWIVQIDKRSNLAKNGQENWVWKRNWLQESRTWKEENWCSQRNNAIEQEQAKVKRI